jgi:futalosine hydrolase
MPTDLILVPTEQERRVLAPLVGRFAGDACRMELCGFGMVAAAARAAQLLARHAPARVLLVGIAGRLDERLAIGAASRFDRVACHGIGAGSGAGFVTAGSMGWLQWPGDPPDPSAAIGDLIHCRPGRQEDEPRTPLLLTAAAASAGRADVDSRKRLFPDAAAEDMEGFAVAAACRLAGVPLRIVRGMSNDAGDRNVAGWRIDAALEAAGDLAARLLAEDA